MVDRTESAADIHVALGNENEIVVQRMTLSKDIDVETIHGSGRFFPDSYALNQASYQGTFELAGDKMDLEEQLFDDNGVPIEATVNVTHFDGGLTSYTPIIVTSEGYEMNDGESTTTTFEFVAFGREHDGRVDTEP